MTVQRYKKNRQNAIVVPNHVHPCPESRASLSRITCIPLGGEGDDHFGIRKSLCQLPQHPAADSRWNDYPKPDRYDYRQEYGYVSEEPG